MIEVIVAIFVLAVIYRERLWQFDYETLNKYLTNKESKHGTIKWGLMQTGMVLLAVFLYVKPSSHCAFMGKYYAMMASNPFGFDPANPVPHRVLTSLLSYLIGMRGQLIIITNLIIAAGLILLIYWYFRKRNSEPAHAFITSAIIAISLVTLNTVYYGGYNDSLSYLLIFLMWAFRKNRILFYSLFLLGLLNRETVVFLIPWFVLLSLELSENKSKRILEVVAGFGISLGLYMLFRYWIGQNQAIEYSASYYLAKFLESPLEMLKYHFNNAGLAFFAVYKLMWIIPAAALVVLWRERKKYQFYGLILLLVCSAAQLPFAYDTSRLFTLGFMVMPLSLIYLFQTEKFKIRKWVIPLFVFNLFIPNLNVVGLKIDVLHSLLSYLISAQLR